MTTFAARSNSISQRVTKPPAHVQHAPQDGPQGPGDRSDIGVRAIPLAKTF